MIFCLLALVLGCCFCCSSCCCILGRTCRLTFDYESVELLFAVFDRGSRRCFIEMPSILIGRSAVNRCPVWHVVVPGRKVGFGCP